MRYNDLHNNLCRPTSSQIPIESRLQPTDDVSSTDSDMSYATNTSYQLILCPQLILKAKNVKTSLTSPADLPRHTKLQKFYRH